jgi:hypothetical protein
MMKAVESKPAPCKENTYRLRKDPTRPRRPYSVYKILKENNGGAEANARWAKGQSKVRPKPAGRGAQWV